MKPMILEPTFPFGPDTVKTCQGHGRAQHRRIAGKYKSGTRMSHRCQHPPTPFYHQLARELGAGRHAQNAGEEVSPEFTSKHRARESSPERRSKERKQSEQPASSDLGIPGGDK